VPLAVAGTGTDLDFKTERKALSGALKNGCHQPEIRGQLQERDKRGQPIVGRGYDCALLCMRPLNRHRPHQANFLKNAILMIPEPFDSTIRQIEAKLNFHDEKLNLTCRLLRKGIYTNPRQHQSVSCRTACMRNRPWWGRCTPAVGTPSSPAVAPACRNVLQLPMVAAA